MAQKSKTQRAKASAARAARKAAREEAANTEAVAEKVEEAVEEKPKRSLLKKDASKEASAAKASSSSKKDGKPKKKRFQFLRDVKAEMKRVTWPTRKDVLRWSVVVVCALIFFGVFTAIMDNAIATPLLVLISGLGA